MGEIYALSVGGRSLAGVAIIAASVLGGFACDTGPADDARSAWLHNTLIEDNQDLLQRSPVLVGQKFLKMASDPYAFMRGTAAQFARDVATAGSGAPLTAFGDVAPRVLIMGDPHLENIGTFRNADGDVRLDFNDFDSAGVGPFIFDLRRLALSFDLAVRPVLEEAAQLEEDDIDRSVRATAAGYVGELRRLVDGEAPIEVHEDEAFGIVIANVFKRAQKDGPSSELLDESSWVTDDDGDGSFERAFCECDVDPPTGGYLTYRLVPVSDPVEREMVLAVIDQWAQTSPAAAGLDRSKVKDMARRYGKGVSSYPVLRYHVMMEGRFKSPDDDWVLDVKEARDALRLPHLHDVIAPDGFQSNGERIVHLQRTLQGHPEMDKYLGWADLAPISFRVQELTKWQKSVGVDRIRKAARDGFRTGDDLERFASIVGAMLARAHAGAQSVNGAPALQQLSSGLAGRETELIEELSAFVSAYAPIVHQDHARLVALLDRYGSTLGASAPLDSP